MTPKKIKVLKNIFYAILLAALVAAAVFLLLRIKVEPTPQPSNTITPAELTQLENKLTRLENLLQTHIQKASPISTKDIAALNEKFQVLQKTNLEILDSKAGIASVMGLIERVDALESQIKMIHAGTSNSALVLTAAALVENAAKKRMPFMYEASVLSELSRGTPMEKSAQIIAGLSVKGIPTKDVLIDRFIKLYEINFLDNQQPNSSDNTGLIQVSTDTSSDWKQKIINKLRSLITIERISANNSLDFEENTDTATDDVYRLVINADFETAILKMSANPKYQTEAFQIWAEDVQAEKIFDKQMAKIKALTLSAMKVESLK